jgi:hypothetical protein
MKAMLKRKICPSIWMYGKAIMLLKRGDINDPMNIRSITLISLSYKTIFGRKAKEFMLFNDRFGKTILCPEWKGFAPGIGEHSQHIFLANLAINHAISENK